MLLGSKATVAEAATAEAAPQIPTASELGRWDMSEFMYDASKAARAGFAFGGAQIQTGEQLFVSEFSRSKWVDGGNGQRLRYGVGVRLLVKTSSMSAQAKLGLSFLAAEAQMRNVSAQSQLSVEGYVGDIAESFVAPGTFNVENYVERRLEMNKLIATIGNDEANMRPLLLEQESNDVEEEEADFQRVVGQLWALSQIADNKSCMEAKSRFPDGATGLVAAAIEDTYKTLSSPFGQPSRPCDDQKLGAGAQGYAKKKLRNLRLKTA